MLSISKTTFHKESNEIYLLIEFYIDRIKDAYILQDYIRAKLHQYCIESRFGYNEYYEEILECNYKCKPYRNIIGVHYSLNSYELKVFIKQINEKKSSAIN